jgi:hypothetical protein
MPKSPQEQTNYSDPKYGVIHRSYFPAGVHHHDDVATAGTHLESHLALPVKANIVAFGIQAASDQDVTMATGDGFELRTVNGTRLATLIFKADTVIGTGDATSAAPETATAIAKNHGMVACVATAVGVDGSVIYFVDWSPEYEAG